MPQTRLRANALEDDDPHVHHGKEASSPYDTGAGLIDVDPPEGLTPAMVEEEHRSFLAEDKKLSDDSETEQ